MIRNDSFFHFLNSDDPSARKIVMFIHLSENFGVAYARFIAKEFNWYIPDSVLDRVAAAP